MSAQAQIIVGRVQILERIENALQIGAELRWQDLAMPALLSPLSFLVACFSGWLNQHQQTTIDYLTEENRVLREQIGNRRLCFTDDQRRRLAVRTKELVDSNSQIDTSRVSGDSH